MKALLTALILAAVLTGTALADCRTPLIVQTDEPFVLDDSGPAVLFLAPGAYWVALDASPHDWTVTVRLSDCWDGKILHSGGGGRFDVPESGGVVFVSVSGLGMLFWPELTVYPLPAPPGGVEEVPA